VLYVWVEQVTIPSINKRGLTITGIWEQVHGSINLDPTAIFDQFAVTAPGEMAQHALVSTPAAMHTITTLGNFSQMSVFCRKVTQASRVCRSIEMVVQARWTVCNLHSTRFE
jgi:ATP-dependent RNA helicase DDX49/DBP8